MPLRRCLTSDAPRPGSRTPVLTIDPEGRLVRFQGLTSEEIEALRRRGGRGGDSPSVPTPVPPGTVTWYPGELVTTYTYHVDDPEPPCRFEHDPAARVYRLTAPDGSVETF